MCLSLWCPAPPPPLEVRPVLVQHPRRDMHQHPWETRPESSLHTRGCVAPRKRILPVDPEHVTLPPWSPAPLPEHVVPNAPPGIPDPECVTLNPAYVFFHTRVARAPSQITSFFQEPNRFSTTGGFTSMRHFAAPHAIPYFYTRVMHVALKYRGISASVRHCPLIWLDLGLPGSSRPHTTELHQPGSVPLRFLNRSFHESPITGPSLHGSSS